MNKNLLENSRAVSLFIRLLDVYETCKERTIHYSGTSIVAKLIKKIYFFPVKTISIILVTVILINIFFSIIFNQGIGLLGWIVRVLFLFIGLGGGVFCNASWQDLKKDSFIINFKIKLKII